MLSLKNFEENELNQSKLRAIIGGGTYWTRGNDTGTDTINYSTCTTSYSDKRPDSNDPNTCQV